jgi:hypothetical protein
MSANSGYGICGAVNVYSSSAKLGNWVEDKAGEILARNPRPAKGMYITDQSANHIDPARMTVNPATMNVKMMSTAELKAKNKEGTSYSLLFDHGKPMKAEDKYRTSYRERFQLKDYEEKFARPENDLAHERAKDAVREIRAQFKQLSGSRTASAYQTQNNKYYVPNAIRGESEPLPVWTRQAICSRTE